MAGSSRSVFARLKEEPLIPLGVTATVGAFLFAAWGSTQGNNKMMQWGMRGRVVMQGLTVAALVGYGLFFTSEYKKERREDKRQINWEKLEQQALAAEKAEKEQPAGKKTPAIFASEFGSNDKK
ncbi:Respiratory supercomplex factor 1, mitochondrial [Coemansia spiralis]|uniref:Respiratory supercomplex factor 1, mitochondrial n=1 Tax=Coemansia spiralis TaxID=417178 RepID=A0A9W8KZ27_9FUNG|nr:hypoxia induced protein conserved region-domain-containing protein [Coemansia spiralis]KAJ2625264.1 Respiratory supercomplex factor 1, mitochondrial [Coemansia sp. RSA 1358]KAJ2677971.1 Respiratory supercomplex factor 1, mitochondrial [Coemansia spiralis]